MSLGLLFLTPQPDLVCSVLAHEFLHGTRLWFSGSVQLLSWRVKGQNDVTLLWFPVTFFFEGCVFRRLWMIRAVLHWPTGQDLCRRVLFVSLFPWTVCGVSDRKFTLQCVDIFIKLWSSLIWLFVHVICIGKAKCWRRKLVYLYAFSKICYVITAHRNKNIII